MSALLFEKPVLECAIVLLIFMIQTAKKNCLMMVNVCTFYRLIHQKKITVQFLHI